LYSLTNIRLFNSNPLILYYNVIGIPFATSKGDNKSIVRLPSLVRGMSNTYHSLSSFSFYHVGHSRMQVNLFDWFYGLRDPPNAKKST
jgi:hypothetical protein